MAVIFLWCGVQELSFPWSLEHRIPEAQDSVRIRIRIVGDPLPGFSDSQSDPVWIPARVEAIWNGQFVPASGRLLIGVPAGQETVRTFPVGTFWEGSGSLRRRDGPHTGLFRSRWRFSPDELHAADSVPGWRAIGVRTLFRVRDRIRSRFRDLLAGRPDERAVLQALLLGNRSDLSREALDTFARSGLIHVFAFSGLHVGMLAWMCWAVLRRLGLGIRSRAWVISPLVFSFVVFSGMRASSLRALIMLVCLWAAPAFYRRTRAQEAFALALCVILALSPGQIQDIGFQFSFLLVAALLAFASSSLGWMLTRLSPDPWAPPNPAREWRERVLWRRGLSAVVVSGWCLLVSAPLTAYHFHLFSPIGFVGNLLAVPLVFLILLTGFPAMLISLLPVPGAFLALEVPRTLCSLLLIWSKTLESVPGGWQWVAAPALGLLMAGYAVLVLLWRFPRWRRPCICLLVALFLMDAGSRFRVWSRSEMWVFPEGRGTTFLLRRPFQPAVLVDTGSPWDVWYVKQALQQRGIDRIGALILTHPDPHHIGGAPELQQMWTPGEILAFSGDVNSLPFETSPGAIHGIHSGQVKKIAGWTVECLHPSPGRTGGRADDRSLVLRCSSGFQSILLMGGGGARVEERLLQEKQPLSARILCAGHPREGALLTDPFLEAVRPEWIVFSGEHYSGISVERRSAEQRGASRGMMGIRARPGETLILNLGRN